VLNIPVDLVDLGLSAMERHSQNDVFFDRSKAKNISEEQLKTSQEMFDWIGAPLSIDVSMDDYRTVMEIK